MHEGYVCWRTLAKLADLKKRRLKLHMAFGYYTVKGLMARLLSACDGPSNSRPAFYSFTFLLAH
jgi:hypothetical protein